MALCDLKMHALVFLYKVYAISVFCIIFYIILFTVYEVVQSRLIGELFCCILELLNERERGGYS